MKISYILIDLMWDNGEAYCIGRDEIVERLAEVVENSEDFDGEIDYTVIDLRIEGMMKCGMIKKYILVYMGI